ncbi:MAG: ABC transporter ATP-binding protein [Actinomycetota bacterium]|nr:ABC transporter ATP-binding protein [Actinomycetota bacterium]
MTAILEVREVVRAFGGLRAVDDASFDVEAGSITALIGPNGAGKSTLFNVISGFLAAERGRVQFEGRRIDRAQPHRIAQRGLLRTFQVPRTLTRMSVLDNVLVAATRHPGERLTGLALRPGLARRREGRARERAAELLALFRLDGHAGEYAGVLSGGQRKLLDFARVLMAEPRLVLLDEPMAGVNPTLGRQLIEHVLRLRTEAGMTFLFVEHDLDIVMEASDHVIVMNEGRVIASGDPEEVRGNQRVVDAYLGTARAQ